MVEGVRPLEEALRHQVLPETVFFSPATVNHERAYALLDRLKSRGTTVAEISDELMREVTDAQTPQGVVGIVPAPQFDTDVFNRPNPWLLIVDRIQDPGNLGTLCRTALAAAVDGVVVLPGTVDPGNPKVVRASAGALFGLNLASLNPSLLIASIQQKGIRVLTADVAAAKTVYEANWTGPVALLVGNEASGPDEMLKAASDELVRIPMPGPVESLNVSVATAICLFEGARQRSGDGAHAIPTLSPDDKSITMNQPFKVEDPC